MKGLLVEHQKSMASEAKRDVKPTAQGPSLRGNIPALVVCKPPKDLPETYRAKLTDKTRVLVDGYQRYEAIKEAGGLEVRVSITEIDVNSTAQLMRKALELNYGNSMPLTRGEKLAHVFRLLLLGEFDDGSPWRPQFEDIAVASTLSEYKRLADFTRKELRLEGLTFDQLRVTLVEGMRDVLGEFEAIHYDSKGFPSKRSVSKWEQVLRKGDVEAWRKEKTEEAARRAEELQDASRSLTKPLERMSPQTRVAVLQRQLAIARAELADQPDEEFKDLFVDEPEEFILIDEDEEF
ncbi:hypothetical protein [Bowmanella dokdonensis]|uniref:ParB/Sulfiredoxin domain-containing protein n=1 Tax=Bowmanella dokdonensis TaxID=751969 RepID=A0A939DRJ6_9ALTE|nr:hypothetical protein [Bowmanella dokdonensis]MBN7827363.1 hypothetical protein [Bowmanella dokdonensis]